ncbi:hypothetical protein [uncultured Ferrovibrio sp.]|mgnify:CR=1 FL=1|jgi:protein TonB|uniref:hypothetical protein n=1 Tax=uncultured Ferrovibrio sp. TaxID=1576913 RepID=UPI00262607E0|nr:hypothetical protein [uncultured Ferrovibrio sp.]
MYDFSENEVERPRWYAVLLAVLLHALLVGVLVLQPWAWQIPAQPPQILAEFVLPEPPKPAPPPAPEPPAPSPQAQPTPARPAPPPPQLQRAPIAEESTSAPGAGDKATEQREPTAEEAPKPEARPAQRSPEAAPRPQAPRPQPQAQRQAGNRQAGSGRAAGSPGETMTQSESDFFLSQIVAAWVIDFRAPQFRDIEIFGNYMVLPNGMLAPPFGKNDPWDMRAMINNWDEIANAEGPRATAFRTAIETFLRAMRLAQPFKMPPNAEGYPKVLRLDFRVGDL